MILLKQKRDTKKIKVYVAGPMSGNELDYLKNIRRGIRASVELLLKGFVPFSPFIDYPFFLALREGEEITAKQIKSYSLEWLEVCDAVLVLEGYEYSEGTQAEIARAVELDIPVFYSMEDLIEWYEDVRLMTKKVR